jgi:hypothetical protein
MSVAMIQAGGNVVLAKTCIGGHVDNCVASFKAVLAFVPDVDHPDATLIIDAE